MERSAAVPVRRVRAAGGHRDQERRPPPREDGDRDRDAGGQKRGGPRRRPLALPEAQVAPLVLLYLLALRALVQVAHRQLLNSPSGAGPPDFSAPRARYVDGPGLPLLAGQRRMESRGQSPPGSPRGRRGPGGGGCGGGRAVEEVPRCGG